MTKTSFTLKKTLALFLILIVTLIILPFSVVFASSEISKGELITESGEYSYAINEDNTVTLTKYLGKEKYVETPETIDDKKVTAIGNDAFYHMNFIRVLIISEGVETIGDSALSIPRDFSNPQSKNIIIKLPSTLKSIGDKCFNSTGISSVYLPDGMENIGELCFSHSKLSRIYIPPSIKSLEYADFLLTNTKIYGESGSYAEEFAIKYDFEFVPEKFELYVPTREKFYGEEKIEQEEQQEEEQVPKYEALDVNKLPNPREKMTNESKLMIIVVSAFIFISISIFITFALQRNRL